MVKIGEKIIEVKGLKSQFGTNVIHENLDLNVNKGSITALVGGSGTGKSVLLRSIIGLKKPDAGSVHVLGKNCHSDQETADELATKWGVLFQDGALYSSLTVLDNIMVPLKEQMNVSHDFAAELAYLKLHLVGLKPMVGEMYPSELSGGMRKRVALARALALDPEILFLDEPTAGLDPIGANDFDDLIHDLVESLGITVVMITHDLDSIFKICDHVAVLADKKVVINAPLSDVLQFDHAWVKGYFNGERSRALQQSLEAKA